MEVEIPSGGCNIYYGTYVDHFTDSGRTRTRYYLSEGKLIESTASTSNYSQLPNYYHCLSSGELTYKPEVMVYFPFLASLVLLLALSLVYKIFIKRLLP